MSDAHYRKTLTDLQDQLLESEERVRILEELETKQRELIISQEELLCHFEEQIERYRARDHRVRIWTRIHTCKGCGRQLRVFTAAVGTRLYSDTNLRRLENDLRAQGIFIKRRTYDEPVPGDTAEEGGLRGFDASKDLWEIAIPDGVPPDLNPDGEP